MSSTKQREKRCHRKSKVLLIMSYSNWHKAWSKLFGKLSNDGRNNKDKELRYFLFVITIDIDVFSGKVIIRFFVYDYEPYRNLTQVDW